MVGPASLLVELLILNSVELLEYIRFHAAKIWTLWKGKTLKGMRISR